MKVVVDTNVLVSGLLNPYGDSSEIVRLAIGGVLDVCYDARILAEFRAVLSKPKFPFDPRAIETLVDAIAEHGTLAASQPLRVALPDPGDECFLAVAVAERVDYLITFNLRHFPPNLRMGVAVVTPVEFLRAYRGKK